MGSNAHQIVTNPCLGNDIPLFGWLFKQKAQQQRKTNLLIFSTPHILATAEDLRHITEHKRRQSEHAGAIDEPLRKSHPQTNFELLLD